MNSETQDHHSALVRAGQAIHARGWAPATSGIDKNDLDGLIRQLLEWIASDTEATPLKALQGMVWKP